MSILRRQQVLPTEAPRSWGWKQGGRASPLIHRTSTLPKPRATAHCGATQSPKEKRPPGSYPPALLPLGLRLVEPRGSLALLRRREAPGRPEEGAQGGRVSSIRQNSQIRNQKVQKLFPNRLPITPPPSPKQLRPRRPLVFPSTASPRGSRGLGRPLASASTFLSFPPPAHPHPGRVPHITSKPWRTESELSSPVMSEGHGASAGRGGGEQKSLPCTHRRTPAYPARLPQGSA